MIAEVTRHPSVGHRMGSCVYPIPPRRIPMSCHPRGTEWTTIIHPHVPPVTKPPATVVPLGSLAPGVGAHAAPSAPGRPTVVDRHRACRSGIIRPLAVAAYHPAGMAPVFAHQHRWDLPAHRSGAWGRPEDVGAHARHSLARHWQ